MVCPRGKAPPSPGHISKHNIKRKKTKNPEKKEGKKSHPNLPLSSPLFFLRHLNLRESNSVLLCHLIFYLRQSNQSISQKQVASPLLSHVIGSCMCVFFLFFWIPAFRIGLRYICLKIHLLLAGEKIKGF